MFGWYVSKRDWNRKCKALYEDDVHGIAQIYGNKFKFGAKCIDGTYPNQPTRVPTRTTTPRPEIRTYKPDRPIVTQRPYNPRPVDPRQTTSRPYYPEEDRPHYEPHRPQVDQKPETCNTNFDAILFYRTELMVFKDEWFWRLEGKPGSFKFKHGREPNLIRNMWSTLPKFDHLDAAFEMDDGNLAFFVGRKIHVISGRNQKLLFSSDLRHFGFDHRFKKVDAIFKWGQNSKTYVFSGKYFWK